MDKKLRLFYQESPRKKDWNQCSRSEKLTFVFVTAAALGTGVLFAVGALMSENRLGVGILMSVIWLIAFPGLVFILDRVEKSLWVELREDCVIRQGDRWSAIVKKTIFYEQARYIVTGHVGPFIVPQGRWWPSAEYYNKRYGDYINVVNKEKEPLFTVRYAQETMDILREKCVNALILDIEDYIKLIDDEISDEIKAADRAIVEQYRGRV